MLTHEQLFTIKNAYEDFQRISNVYEKYMLLYAKQTNKQGFTPPCYWYIPLLLKHIYIEADLLITKVLLELYRSDKNISFFKNIPYFKKKLDKWDLLPLEDSLIHELYCMSQYRNILIQHESSNFSKGSVINKYTNQVSLNSSSLWNQTAIQEQGLHELLVDNYNEIATSLCNKYEVKFSVATNIYMTKLFYTIPRKEKKDREQLHAIVSQIGCVDSRNYSQIQETMKEFIKNINKPKTSKKSHMK